MLRRRTAPAALVFAGLVALGAAASWSSAGGGSPPAGGSAPQGSNGGPCYPNMTCDATLSCDVAANTCGAAKAGTETGPCYPNMTCNAGLSCISMVCVNKGGAGGAGGAGPGGAGGSGAGASAGMSAGGMGVGASGNSCAGTAYVAKQDPAALLFVADRSASMFGIKWQSLGQAIVSAMDDPEFDTMSVGLLAAPSGQSPAPACISFVLPTVPCLAPTAPQIAIADVGSKPSSDASGLRGQVKAWVASGGPTMPPGLTDPDASPLYAAIKNGLASLASWPKTGKRILVIVTDGSIDCNEGTGRPGFPDANGCAKEWEDPTNIVELVKAANADATNPIDTFVVGVPGADTFDPSGANNPPYHMRLALSSIAYAGAPKLVDPKCTGTMFSQGGGDPAVPCHFDMTQGAFDAKTLGENLGKIRAKTLGCTFALPTPPNGDKLDPTKVNVQINFGMGLVSVPKRGDPNDMCLDHPCWDYDANGKVEIIGQACMQLESTGKAAVSIVAGCDTIVIG